MKLQLALDEFQMDEALVLAHKVEKYVDIIEIGTPFVIGYGMQAVRRFKEEFPDKEILSDEKIMDGGYLESKLAYDAGAEYVTVLAATENLTIKSCLKARDEYKKQVVVDFVDITNLAERVKECEELGVDVLAVHTGADQQAVGRTPLEDLKVMTSVAKHTKIAVAGGINSKTIDQYVALNPDIIIVGSAIGHAEDPVEEARLIKTAMEKA